MESGIRIEVIWFDVHGVALRVDGSNGRFAGSVELYANHDVFSRLANAIRRFPVSTTDVRQFEAGALDETYAGGGIRLKFLWPNHGHPVIEMFMRADPNLSRGQTEMTIFQISVEPAGIDDFVAQLDDLKVAVGSAASLRRAA